MKEEKKPLSKAQIILEIHQHINQTDSQVSLRTVRKIYDKLIELVTTSISENKKQPLPGIGIFEAKVIKEKKCLLPRCKSSLIPAHMGLKFRKSKQLKEMLAAMKAPKQTKAKKK